MTIQDALEIADEMKPNMMSSRLKMKYLTEIEQLIHEEIIMKHHHPAYMDKRPEYTEESEPDTVLLIPDPYAMVYVYWLMSKIDIQTQEDGRYNVDRSHFENAYATMSDWFTREHMPIRKNREIRI